MNHSNYISIWNTSQSLLGNRAVTVFSDRTITILKEAPLWLDEFIQICQPRTVYFTLKMQEERQKWKGRARLLHTKPYWDAKLSEEVILHLSGSLFFFWCYIITVDQYAKIVALSSARGGMKVEVGFCGDYRDAIAFSFGADPFVAKSRAWRVRKADSPTCSLNKQKTFLFPDNDIEDRVLMHCI